MPTASYRPHPWHGLEVGPKPPEVLNAYIEITPFDLMKYEIDKLVPGQKPRARINRIYGRTHALKVVRAAMLDYDASFGK